jgi:hypothetical protein
MIKPKLQFVKHKPLSHVDLNLKRKYKLLCEYRGSAALDYAVYWKLILEIDSFSLVKEKKLPLPSRTQCCKKFRLKCSNINCLYSDRNLKEILLYFLIFFILNFWTRNILLNYFLIVAIYVCYRPFFVFWKYGRIFNALFGLMTVSHWVQVLSLDQASSCELASTEALRDTLPSNSGNWRMQNSLTELSNQ